MNILAKHKRMIVFILILLIVFVVGTTVLLFQSIASRVNYSREQIVEGVENKFEGKVIDIDVEHELFHTYYEVKLVDKNNQTIEILVNASDATIVEFEVDD